ncbi:MAG: DinB family protein [Dehalococcoidia bacterium]|nr:DinB family protein [Dehalococcoidia bacterium]
MHHEAFDLNERERVRLVTLVASLTEADLRVVVHDEWTIAAKLAHIALWDRIALAVLERWRERKESRIEDSQWRDDVFNDAVLIESLVLNPLDAARLAVDAVSALDRRLESLGEFDTTRLISDAAKPETDTTWLLHRYRHRALHLDEIDRARRSLGR